MPSAWNIDLFEELLTDYEDKGIIQFIRYGWPVEAKQILHNNDNPFLTNQRGARRNVDKVNKYLKEEKLRGAIVGPFQENPLPGAMFSPVDAIPKKESSDLRIITNLSYPYNDSAINVHVDNSTYLGEEVDLTYPGLDQLVRIVRKKGRGSLLFKRDLRKFYRQIYLDPGVVHYFGFVINHEVFFDVVLTMGLNIACYIAQCISNVIMHIYKRLSYEGINYLDDLGAAEIAQKAWSAYNALGQLLSKLGIWEALDKASPPNFVMTFLRSYAIVKLSH